MLAVDEAAIAQRKAAVRNFGASWIRPPGISKTLQAMTEEEAERAEQAELERQERGLMDMQAQQQLEEARARADEAAAQADAGEEVNLDDEIPEAEATTADVTFNEDSVVEGSHMEAVEQEEDEHERDVAREEAELTGAARDEEELGIEHERDLDDSVPEAGSYQHTDTEEEDSYSESERENSSSAVPSARQTVSTSGERQNIQVQLMTGLQERMRAQVAATDALPRSPATLNLSSSVLDTSFQGSSPVVQRPSQTDGGRSTRRRQGRLS